MSDHPIGYQGPSDNYEPPVGFNQQTEAGIAVLPNIIGGYADLNYCNQILAGLISLCIQTSQDMTTALNNVALVVTTNDTQLINANEVLWPSNLGPMPNYVTYRYYNSLATVNSSAAQYVRQAYEKACRGVTGTNAIDLLPIVQMCLDEANLIQEFIVNNAGQLSDSSQRRTVELVQDWIETATQQVQTAAKLFTQGGSIASLPADEVSTLSTQDATNTQAVFQINLNQLNSNVTQSLGILQKNFASYSNTFYKNFLGPAVNFRNSVGTSVTPQIMPPTISAHVSTAAGAINNNLKSILADQLRRNQIFDTQTQSVLTNVQLRDTYRGYIQQLSTTGASVTAGTAGTVIQATDSPDAAQFFDTTASTAITPTNPYASPHSQLSNLTDPTAHPQYFLKDGDTLGGNMELADSVLIDGMRPSTHAHTGHDGTVQISGDNILPGSVGTGVINSGDMPDSPGGISIISETVYVVPPGVTVVNTVLGWEGDPSLTYEVQVVKVD